MCFVVRKITSELERVILTTLYLASAKNTDNTYGGPNGRPHFLRL
jgi:hypothetical protein